jgi:hypothetical protein
LTALAAPVCAQAQNLNFWFAGPRSVPPGGRAIVATGASVDVSAFKANARATLENLPPDARGYVITNITWYRDTAEINLNSSFGFKINTSPSTPQGHYNVVLRIDAKEAATGQPFQARVNFDFRVRPPANPIARVASSFPIDDHIDGLEQWERQMLQYGSKHVNQDNIGCCGAYTGPWYYDGARAFLQMYDYTGHEPFLEFATKVHNVYRDYMLAGGSGKLYANFPHGLVMFYERFGDEQAKEAIRVMQGNTPGHGPQYHWGAGWGNSRPEAYGLSLHLAKQRLGFPRVEGRKDLGYESGETYFDQCLANVLGQMEQWFVSEKARFVYPFLVGLNAEALIEYYEVSHDPEVPYLLKLAADKMYPNPLTWHEASESMMIVEEKNGLITRGPAPDLNLMIAPLYAWVCQQTGDVKYCDIADRIFVSGVKKAYLDGGKQFTQSYRWSFKYLEWRNRAYAEGQGYVPPSAPAPILSISVSPPSIEPGQAATVSWSSSNATACFSSGAWGGNKPIYGSTGVQPDSSATYQLTCTGSGGSITRSASVSVSNGSKPAGNPPVNPPADPEGSPAVELNASAPVVQRGAAVTLSWAASEASDCQAMGAWSGSRPVRGSEAVRVYSDTRYTLRCSGSAGSTSQTLRVRVGGGAPSGPLTPAPSVELNASATRIRPGQSATLSWSSQNSTLCRASGGWSSQKSPSGSETVQPSETTLYVLGCAGPSGGASRVVRIVVD